MIQRPAEAGVTLVEMLSALAVAALIGIAGFTLLEGVLTRDAQLSGRLERISDHDRALQLLRADASRARRAAFSRDTGLTLSTRDQTIGWRADTSGMTRHIAWPDGRSITQQVLHWPAELAVFDRSPRAVVLTLSDDGPGRIVMMPDGLAQ